MLILILSKEYLQVLVDEMSSNYKVDMEIIDLDGSIIACNKKERVNHLHKNDISGMTTPIVFEDKCYGSFFVSGIENNNKEMVKAMLIATNTAIQYELIRASANNSRNEEYLIRELISGKVNQDDEVIKEWGNQLGYDINMPRAVILIELIPKKTQHFNINLGYENSVDDMRRIVKNEVRNNKYLNNQDIVLFYKDEYLLVIKSFFDMLDRERKYKALDKICQSLNDDIAENKLFQISIAYGRLADKFAKIKSSYDDALEILELSKRLKRQPDVFSIQDFIYEDIVYNLNENILDKCLSPIISIILTAEKKSKIDICKTVRCYLESNCSVSETAKKLFLHRNSIILRLEKISKITGLDIVNNISHLFLLKLAVTYIEINILT